MDEANQNEIVVVDTSDAPAIIEQDDAEELITCRRCGAKDVAHHKHNKHLCVPCVKMENSRVSHFRQHNDNWVELAKDAELELWERQPAETDREYQIWMVYRDSSPGIRPTYRHVAEHLDTSLNVVKKVGQRWDFKMRMMAWADHIDEVTLEARTNAIVGMNKKHISMADRLNEKLSRAIDLIDVDLLKPNEIKDLLKVSAELERKAHEDVTSDFKHQIKDRNESLKKIEHTNDELAEIAGILAQAGVLDNANVGIKRTTTTTTEIVAREE